MTIEQQLDAAAGDIIGARDLYQLLDAIDEFYSVCADNDLSAEMEMRARNIDMCALPTFGGPEPDDTDGVWSWDEDELIVGEGDLKIISRAEFAEREEMSREWNAAQLRRAITT